MTRRRRIEDLEVAHHRRILARVAPPGRADDVLDLAIQWLEMSRAQQRTDMPQFTEAELTEINSWLPAFRRMRFT